MGRDWALGEAWMERLGRGVVRRGSGLSPDTPWEGGWGGGAVGVGRNGAARVALCWQELDDAQEAQCSRVERAGEDPHSYYLPGQFAFIKALSP